MRLLLTFLLPLWCAFSLSAQSVPTHSPASSSVGYEVRAVWLTTLMGLDWPSRPAVTEEQAAQQKAQLCDMLDRLRAVGINTVLFQTRLRGTTAYASAIEPWDGVFAGTPGKRPPYDPLRFAVEACHERGMECHAWVVAFPVCKVSVAKQLGKRSLPQQHPELCQRCGDQWMMDPGVPSTATYLADVCREIVQNYEVDGIHLDYIRYPESGIPFNDDRTYKLYGNGQMKAAWRAANINRCVQLIHDAVKGVRPWVKLSCSPVGKYSDLSRYSSYGWNARDAVSQDAQSWLKKGWMDMLFPMMYFDGKHFYPFLADWRDNASGRPVVPGLGVYMLNEREKNWPLLAIQRQLNVMRQLGMGGAAFFRAKFLLNNEKGVYDWLKSSFYAQQALVPPMTWLDSIAPEAPKVEARIDGQQLSLSWNAVADSDGEVTYNVYRLDAERGDVLLATHIKQTHYEQTLLLPAFRHSRYVVTAVDVYGNESKVQSEE